MKYILVFLVGCFVITGVNAQSYNLKYKLIKNKDYRFYQKTEMKMIQDLGIMDQEMKNDFGGLIRFIPVKFENENMVLKTCFESLYVNVESILFSMKYDSESVTNESPALTKVYNQIINKDFNVVITPTGNVIRIEGIDKIIDDAVKVLGNINPSASAQLKNALIGQMGKESLKGNMEMIFGVYPAGSKKVGDQWNTSTRLTSLLKADLNNNWTFADASNKQWKILGKGNVSTTGENSKLNGIEVKLDLKGKQKCEYTLNQEDGWFIKGKQIQNVKGFITMSGNSSLPQGFEIPTTLESVTYIERR